MDLLAIAVADPTVLPLWGAFLFAVGMWPVGMFFGCNTCCCTACTEGSLPETITVSFSGFSDEQVPGPDLISLEFSSCYGSGAQARVTAPGGNADTDKGPISVVQVLDGGDGYAKIGRVAPTVTVSGTSGSGTGATFDVTLASSKDACGVDRWAVSKVVRTGGTGYENGDTLTLAIAEGDTQEVAAQAKISGTAYVEPTLSLSVAGGTGAVLQIDGYNKTTDSWWLVPSDTWRISGITVANGGSGYTDNTLVTVNLGSGDEARPWAGSNLRVRTAIVEPTGEWTLEAHDGSYNPSAGSGLALSFTLARLPSNVNPIGWEVTAATVTSGGSGYAAGEIVDAYLASSAAGAALEITSVDQNGAVTGISIVNGGEHEGTDSGVIESVANLFSQAGWRKAVNNPDGVIVTNGGIYYREDTNAPAYVSPVTISVTQTLPSAGTGASLSAVIDDDPSSETFGQITAVTIDNGGDDYLAWQYRPVACCEDYWNGKSFVLKRISGSCYYQHVVCGTQCGETITVVYRGPSLPPVVDVGGWILWYENGSPIVAPHASACYQSLEGESLVTNCSDFSFTATNEAGVTATVAAGGTYDPQDQSDNGTGRCHPCCRGEGDPPEEIEVEVADGHYIPGQPGSIGWFYPGLLGPSNYPLPIFVLRRGWQFMTPPQDGSPGCYAVWSASVPVVGGGATDLWNWDLAVSVSTCSNPSVVDCDHCWKKCETTAFVQTYWNCYGTSAKDRGGSEGCLNCTESPMCGPAAGEYFITKNIFGHPLCNIPGGVRMRVL